MQHYVDTMPCRVNLVSADPDGLKGVRTDKLAKARQLSYPIVKPYSDARNGQEQWCVAAVPGAAWAKKLFPELEREQAVEKLVALRRLEGHNLRIEMGQRIFDSLVVEIISHHCDSTSDYRFTHENRRLFRCDNKNASVTLRYFGGEEYGRVRIEYKIPSK
jgi:hypothetical protein